MTKAISRHSFFKSYFLRCSKPHPSHHRNPPLITFQTILSLQNTWKHSSRPYVGFWSDLLPLVLLYTRDPYETDLCSTALLIYIVFFFCGAATQRGSWPPHSWGVLDHTQRRTTVGRAPLDKWSARRKDLYLTTHNPHKRQTSMPAVGFEPTISADERPQTYALDRAATGTGSNIYCIHVNF